MVKGYIIPDPIISSSTELFWDPETENEAFAIIGPSPRTELNKAPSFEFTVVPSNIWYDHFNRKKTIILIYDGDDLLFEGRVSSLSTDFYKQKKVSCEGVIAYLMDSLQPGDRVQDGTITEVENNGYHSEPTEVSTKESIETHLRRMIARHNNDVEEFKQIHIGVIDAKSGIQEFDSSGYRTTWEAIESDIIDRFGGYVQVRRGLEANGENPDLNYLDYLPIEKLTGSTSNTMTFGENIIELTQEESEDDEIFTILLPFGKELEGEVDSGGKKKKVRNRVTIEHASNAVTTEPTDGKEISPYQDPKDPRFLIVSPVALQKYGAIYRCMDFDDKETPEALWTRAVEYINDTCGFRNTYEVKALDMHVIDPVNRPRTKVGDRVRMKSKWHGVDDHSLYVKAAQYDLENPENDTFTIGFPYQEREDKKISSSTSDSAKGKSSGKSGGGGYGGGGGGATTSKLDAYIRYNDGRLEVHTAWIAEVVDINTGRSTRLEQDERHIALTADAIIGHVDGESPTEQYNRLSNLEVSDTGVRCIVQIQNDHGNKLMNHESRMEMTEDQIQLFTGNMYVEESDVTFTEVPSTEIKDTTNPNKHRWWERRDESALDVHDPKKFKITPDTAPTEGKKYYTKAVSKSSIVIVEGAGMYNEKDRTRYGLWDEGNLTAGVLCERINNPEFIEVSVGEKEAAHARGDNPSTKEPWWYVKEDGIFVRTSDKVVFTNTHYYMKTASQTQTQIKGDRVIIGVTSKYSGMDAANKAKLDKYLADHNLDATITEIASDVVVVNTLLAKYIETDEITVNTKLAAEGGFFNHLYVYGDSESDTGWTAGLTATSADIDWLAGGHIRATSIQFPASGGIGFGYDGGYDIGSLADPSNIVVGFGTITTEGDTVKIPYTTLSDYCDGTPDNSHVLSFDKPASLGSVTWSSGNNTLTAKTAGGKDFLVGNISNYIVNNPSEAQQMATAGYLATATSGYDQVYGLYYTRADGTQGKTMLFKTPKDRYEDGKSDGIATAKGKFGLYGPGAATAANQTEATALSNATTLSYGSSYMVYKTYDGELIGSKTYFKTPSDRYNTGKNDGANSLTIDPSSDVTLGYSESKTVTATTTKADGTKVKKSVKITAPSSDATSHSVSCDLTADKDHSYTEKGSDYTRIFTDVTFTNQKWYRFEVKCDCGNSSITKKYAIYIKTS